MALNEITVSTLLGMFPADTDKLATLKRVHAFVTTNQIYSVEIKKMIEEKMRDLEKTASTQMTPPVVTDKSRKRKAKNSPRKSSKKQKTGPAIDYFKELDDAIEFYSSTENLPTPDQSGQIYTPVPSLNSSIDDLFLTDHFVYEGTHDFSAMPNLQ